MSALPVNVKNVKLENIKVEAPTELVSKDGNIGYKKCFIKYQKKDGNPDLFRVFILGDYLSFGIKKNDFGYQMSIPMLNLKKTNLLQQQNLKNLKAIINEIQKQTEKLTGGFISEKFSPLYEDNNTLTLKLQTYKDEITTQFYDYKNFGEIHDFEPFMSREKVNLSIVKGLVISVESVFIKTDGDLRLQCKLIQTDIKPVIPKPERFMTLVEEQEEDEGEKRGKESFLAFKKAKQEINECFLEI